MILRIVLGSVAGAVVIMLLAFLFFGVLFSDFFAASIAPEFRIVGKEVPDFLPIAAADLLYALMLSMLLTRVIKKRTFLKGAVVGLLIGMTVALHFDLIAMGTTHLKTYTTIAANTALSGIMSAIGAGVIGAILGFMERGSGIGSAKTNDGGVAL